MKINREKVVTAILAALAALGIFIVPSKPKPSLPPVEVSPTAIPHESVTPNPTPRQLPTGNPGPFPPQRECRFEVKECVMKPGGKHPFEIELSAAQKAVEAQMFPDGKIPEKAVERYTLSVALELAQAKICARSGAPGSADEVWIAGADGVTWHVDLLKGNPPYEPWQGLEARCKRVE